MSGRQRIGAATFILAIAAALSGCSGGERSAEYFAAHEADAKQVLADCTAGRARGPECDNAQRGLQKALKSLSACWPSKSSIEVSARLSLMY